MEDIHDIVPPISPHLSYLPLYVLFGLIVFALAFLLMYWIYKKRAGRSQSIERTPEPPPPIDYKARAQARLQKARKLLETSHFDEYFVEVSSIVKEYLGGAHNVNALEMTSSELIKKFKDISELPLFFELCYRYEFAGLEAQREDAETVFSLAQEIVEMGS
jgi:hypothetical protein